MSSYQVERNVSFSENFAHVMDYKLVKNTIPDTYKILKYYSRYIQDTEILFLLIHFKEDQNSVLFSETKRLSSLNKPYGNHDIKQQ